MADIPLYTGALSAHLELARYLVEKGADVNAKMVDGATPLHICARYGHLEVARALIEADLT